MDEKKIENIQPEPLLTIEQPVAEPAEVLQPAPVVVESEPEAAEEEVKQVEKEPAQPTPSLREEIEKRAGEEDTTPTRAATLRSILAGDILTSGAVKRQVWLVLLVTLFIFIYITFRYKSETNMLKIDRLHTELQDARFKAMAAQSKLTESTRQSKVLEALRNNNDSTLKSSNQHPYIIIVPKKHE